MDKFFNEVSDCVGVGFFVLFIVLAAIVTAPITIPAALVGYVAKKFVKDL